MVFKVCTIIAAASFLVCFVIAALALLGEKTDGEITHMPGFYGAIGGTKERRPGDRHRFSMLLSGVLLVVLLVCTMDRL